MHPSMLIPGLCNFHKIVNTFSYLILEDGRWTKKDYEELS